MLLMLMIPILLTIVPGMLYQSMRLLARKKSTPVSYTHLFMRDGVIWEEGTPQQIFENPQKAETQEFLSRFRAH